MSGICSEHKHHELGCPRCDAGGVMKPEEINRVIAEKVMGWRLREPSYESPQGWWEGSEEEYNLEDWNPAERIDHAMMALQKFENWNLHKRTWFDKPTGYRCSIEPQFSSRWTGTVPLAICLAALEAVKEE